MLRRSTRQQLAANIVEYYRKPVMGRRASLSNVARIVHSLAQIIHEASRQPEVHSALEAIAADGGTSLEAATERWCRLEEADILLESGGDPEDVSVAHAVGVAQWIYETGKQAGLKIDLPTSNRLTPMIDDLKWRIAWCDYLSQPGSLPPPHGAPQLSSEIAGSELPQLRAQLEVLRARRRAVDERYDVPKALRVHALYLLGLYKRFPHLQWVFMAFHGGEAGATRELKRYLGSAWPGSAAAAIQHGSHGKHLTYEDVYFTIAPNSHVDAFSYIYGRGDDHRHYWWKLRAALEAIESYRKNEAEFRREWEALLPGRAKEALWYPNGPEEALADDSAVHRAHAAGHLVRIRPNYAIVGSLPSGHYALLQPTSAGLLRLIADVNRREGGAPIEVGDMTVTPAALRAAAAVPAKPAKPGKPAKPAKPAYTANAARPMPPVGPPPGGGPAADFNYHTTGIAFDLLRPADDRRRKILEYALGWLQDRGILWQMEETDRGPRRYHVVPNPHYEAALREIARTGRLPDPGSLRYSTRCAGSEHRAVESGAIYTARPCGG